MNIFTSTAQLGYQINSELSEHTTAEMRLVQIFGKVNSNLHRECDRDEVYLLVFTGMPGSYHRQFRSLLYVCLVAAFLCVVC